MVKKPPANARNLALIPGLGDPLEKGIATHSSILAWRISWTEEPGRLQSLGSQRVGCDLATKQQLSLTRKIVSNIYLDYLKSQSTIL